MFEVQLFFTLFVISAWATALLVGGFIGWFLCEREGAPFKDKKDSTQDDD